MATIMVGNVNITREHGVRPTSEAQVVRDDPFHAPKKKMTFWQRVGLKFAGCVPWLCGVSSDDWFVAEEDQKKFTEMRGCMRSSYGIATHLPKDVDPSLVGTVILRERQGGVELSEPAFMLRELLKQVEAGTLTEDKFKEQICVFGLWDAYHGMQSDYSPTVPRWSAKFAAGVVLTLRAKFGPLERNEANLLLIEREYLTLCRRNFVRANVIVDHEPYIVSQFFQQTAAEQRLAARRRLPGWMRAALDDVKLSGAGVYA